MPIDFSVDADGQIVHLRCSDPLGPDDVMTALNRQIREGCWQFGTLVDARASGLDAKQSAALFGRVQQLVAQHGPNGPVALVTRAPEHVGGGQVIAVRGAGLAMKFEVFWDVSDADAWLRKELGRVS